jgi:hypothetical protein
MFGMKGRVDKRTNKENDNIIIIFRRVILSMAHTLSLDQIVQLPPEKAIKKLEDLTLSTAFANQKDLYIRLYLVSLLQDKCEFDIAHINHTIAFFKNKSSIPVASLLLQGHTPKGKESLKPYHPTDAQLEGISEVAEIIAILKPVYGVILPSTWSAFQKFSATEVENALGELKTQLLRMRIPSRRKPKQDIDLEDACEKKMRYSRENVSLLLLFPFHYSIDTFRLKERTTEHYTSFYAN